MCCSTTKLLSVILDQKNEPIFSVKRPVENTLYHTQNEDFLPLSNFGLMKRESNGSFLETKGVIINKQWRN